MKYEPDYTCEVCNTGMTKDSIRHTHTPRDNSRPLYFCSIGCYYQWAEGMGDYGAEEYQYEQ